MITSHLFLEAIATAARFVMRAGGFFVGGDIETADCYGIEKGLETTDWIIEFIIFIWLQPFYFWTNSYLLDF